MTMNLYSYEQMKAVAQLAATLRGEADPKRSHSQNLSRALLLHCGHPNAQQAADDLISGIDAYRALYRQTAGHTPQQILADGLDRLMIGMEEEEQRSLLSDLLGCSARLTGTAQPEPAVSDIDTLRKAVVDHYTRYSLPDTLDALGELPFTLRSQLTTGALLEALEDSENTIYTALALYITQQRGALPGQDSPAAVGAKAAASAEAQKTMLARARNRLGAVLADEQLQVILATLAVVLLTVLVAGAAVTLQSVLRTQFIQLYGTANLAYLFPTVYCVGGVWVMAYVMWHYTAGTLITELNLLDEWAAAWQKFTVWYHQAAEDARLFADESTDEDACVDDELFGYYF